MENFASQMSMSDMIQLAGISLSLITSIVAILISVKTLTQSSKMIEDASRPYLVIYSGVTNFQNPNYHLILKNFGQSGASITFFSCDHDLNKYSYSENLTPFKHIIGKFMAPGQSLTCAVSPKELFSKPEPLVFHIKYEFSGNKYEDSFILNIEADNDMMHTRACSTGKELRTISYTLQDIAEKML
jgi:hypothetical protein